MHQNEAFALIVAKSVAIVSNSVTLTCAVVSKFNKINLSNTQATTTKVGCTHNRSYFISMFN